MYKIIYFFVSICIFCFFIENKAKATELTLKINLSKDIQLKNNYKNLISLDELEEYSQSLQVVRNLLNNIKYYNNKVIRNIIKYNKILPKKTTTNNLAKFLLLSRTKLNHNFVLLKKTIEHDIANNKFNKMYYNKLLYKNFFKNINKISNTILLEAKDTLNSEEFNILSLFILHKILLNYKKNILYKFQRNNIIPKNTLTYLEYIKYLFNFLYNTKNNNQISDNQNLIIAQTLNILGIITFKINEINTAIDSFKAALFILFNHKKNKNSIKLIAQLYKNIQYSYSSLGDITNANIFKKKFNNLIQIFPINIKDIKNLNYNIINNRITNIDNIYIKNIKKKQLAKIANIIKLDKVTTRSYIYSINIQDIVNLGAFKIKIHACILPPINRNFKKNYMLALVSIWDNKDNKNISNDNLIYQGWLNSFNKSLDSFAHYRYNLQLLNCK